MIDGEQDIKNGLNCKAILRLRRWNFCGEMVAGEANQMGRKRSGKRAHAQDDLNERRARGVVN